MEKIVVIGTDGGSWNLLWPWIQEGELPNLEKIRENGYSGDLRSTHPYVTVPAWKAYSTGRNPGRFGVFYWFTFDEEDGELEFVNSEDFRSREIWDYLSDEGISSGVINMPSTHPPSEIDEFMVSGTLASNEDDFTHPEELKDQLLEKDYQVEPTAEKKTREWVDEIKSIVSKRTDLALEKLDEVDFLHLTFFFTDRVQHNYWNSDETLEVWKEVDRQIGRIMEQDVNIILMSDHGFQDLERFFYVNSWLEEKGYLRRNKDVGDKIQKTGLNRDRLFSLVKKLGLQDLARKLIPKSVRRRIPREDGFVEETDMAPKIDFQNSKAFALSEGPLYIIEENVEDPETFKERLKEELESFENGEIVREVKDGDQIYEGEFGDEAPDLFLDQAPGVEIRMDLSDKVIDEECGASSWIANHRQEGIWAAHGPDFWHGELDLEIYDLMPTILHHYGLSIPSDVDGRVVTEIYKSGVEKEVKRDDVEDIDI
ncbi:MAG: alkaline phosphatase family protein [Candidatus Nanohaloarchaea archaeon]